MCTSCSHRSGPTLVQEMVCCLTAPSHYQNQCWFLISEILWRSPGSDFKASGQAAIRYYGFKNCTFKTTLASSRGQWQNLIWGIKALMWQYPSQMDKSHWQQWLLLRCVNIFGDQLCHIQIKCVLSNKDPIGQWNIALCVNYALFILIYDIYHGVLTHQ